VVDGRAVESAALWTACGCPQGLDNASRCPHFPQRYCYGCHLYSTTLPEIVPKKATPFSLTQGCVAVAEMDRSIPIATANAIRTMFVSFQTRGFGIRNWLDGVFESILPLFLSRFLFRELMAMPLPIDWFFEAWSNAVCQCQTC
jgi:hypothetical protein